MTNREKLLGLNADFQRLYYKESDLSFFTHDVPEKIKGIESFILSLVPEGHRKRNEIINMLAGNDMIIETLKTHKFFYNSGNNIKADLELLDAKTIVCRTCWYVFRELSNWDSETLEKVI